MRYSIPAETVEIVESRAASVEVELEGIATAIADADEQSWPLLSWDDRIRYETLARAAIKAMGGSAVRA